MNLITNPDKSQWAELLKRPGDLRAKMEKYTPPFCLQLRWRE